MKLSPRELLLWQSIASGVRQEHDAGGGIFSTEEVELVEKFVKESEVQTKSRNRKKQS